VFGEYVSTYDFQRAVDDKATVPLYYDARGEKLGVAIGDLNERIAEKLEELETDDIDVEQRLERELKRDYHIITADKRLDQVARDFVQHYSTAWETGKAMLVCIDKITCVRMHKLIGFYWDERIRELEKEKPLPPTSRTSCSAAPDRLDARDAHGRGGERGTGRGREVPQMGPGHHSPPQADQGRHRPAGVHARQARIPQHQQPWRWTTPSRRRSTRFASPSSAPCG
jgi:hypothetical protein